MVVLMCLREKKNNLHPPRIKSLLIFCFRTSVRMHLYHITIFHHPLLSSPSMQLFLCLLLIKPTVYNFLAATLLWFHALLPVAQLSPREATTSSSTHLIWNNLCPVKSTFTYACHFLYNWVYTIHIHNPVMSFYGEFVWDSQSTYKSFF